VSGWSLLRHKRPRANTHHPPAAVEQTDPFWSLVEVTADTSDQKVSVVIRRDRQTEERAKRSLVLNVQKFMAIIIFQNGSRCSVAVSTVLSQVSKDGRGRTLDVRRIDVISGARFYVGRGSCNINMSYTQQPMQGNWQNAGWISHMGIRLIKLMKCRTGIFQ